MKQDAQQATHEEPLSSGGELVAVATRFLRVVKRRRNVMYATFVVCGAIGLVYYGLATRLYKSSAKILIIQQNQDHLSTVGDHVSSDNTMATHKEIVASPVVLKEAIRRLAPADRVDLVDRPPQDWVDELAKRLRASTTRHTNFIDVSYRSRRPETAAAVVRAVLSSYLDFVRETHQGTAGELKSVLADERVKLERSLAEKQAALQEHRQQVGHLAVSNEGGVVDPIIQRALGLNEALMETQQQRLELQAKLASIDGAISRGENIDQHLAGIEKTVGQQFLMMTLGISPQDMTLQAQQQGKLMEAQDELRRLSAFLGPNHPTIQQLQRQSASLETFLSQSRMNLHRRSDPAQNAELGVVVKDMLEQAIVQVEQRESQLLESFDAARALAARQSGRVVELQMLEREVARIERLHDLLFDKIATVDFRQVQAPIQATVVKEPLPNATPVSPQLRFVLTACLFGGVGLGCMVVYIQDVLDDRFDSPEELSSQLGVPILAMVQRLNPLDVPGIAGIHTHASPNSPDTEAFRTLRTALTLNASPSQRLLVSSSEPGDGKTTVSVNLAVAFAQAGKRTILIDADLRKPGLTTLLDLKSQPGVANILLSDEPIQAAASRHVGSSEVVGLDVLPTGFRQPNPAELLGRPRFAELLAWAETHYDQVVVDCPPVLAVSDAQVVGQLVDGGILVVRPDKNHRRLVTRAVESFTATGCHVLGVVANGISPEMSDYGYGYGYGHGYGTGYGHDDVSDQRDDLPDQAADIAADAGTASSRTEPIDSAYESVLHDALQALSDEPAAPIRPRRAA